MGDYAKVTVMQCWHNQLDVPITCAEFNTLWAMMTPRRSLSHSVGAIFKINPTPTNEWAYQELAGLRGEAPARLRMPGETVGAYRKAMGWPLSPEQAAETNAPRGSCVMSPVSVDSPLMKAWTAYKLTDAYANTKKWSGSMDRPDDNFWAVFSAGFEAAAAAQAKRVNQFWLIERGPNQGFQQHQWWNAGPDGRGIGWKNNVHEATLFASAAEANYWVLRHWSANVQHAVTSHSLMPEANP